MLKRLTFNAGDAARTFIVVGKLDNLSNRAVYLAQGENGMVLLLVSLQ